MLGQTDSGQLLIHIKQQKKKKLLPSLSALTRTNKVYTIRDKRLVSQSVEVSVQCMCCSVGWLFIRVFFLILFQFVYLTAPLYLLLVIVFHSAFPLLLAEKAGIKGKVTRSEIFPK